MILVVSHFTNNLGTADYFLQFLKLKNRKYVYLRHPLDAQSKRFSELIYYDGQKEKLILKIWQFKNKIFSLFSNIIINFLASIILAKKVGIVVSFGGFNFFPFLFLNRFYKRKLYFWGVDYSTKRFNNKVLNRLYFYFETIACRFSALVIQPTTRQQDARVSRHGLDIKKSIIIPNGVCMINFSRNILSDEIALLYIGSITKQHGIVDFVKYFYENKKINIKLYIFGAGELENELKKIICRSSLSDMIVYFGVKNQNEIKTFLKNCRNRLFGVAPYSMECADHVYFGDSIKVKEYLSYNIPFITSKVAYITPDISRFGFVYSDYRDLFIFLKGPISKIMINNDDKDDVLKEYLWENVFNKFYIHLNK